MDVALPQLAFRGSFPPQLPAVGRVLRDPVRYWPPEILDQSVVEAVSGGKRLVLLTSPEAVNEILQNRAGGFARSRLQDRILGMAYGDKLAGGDRPEWRHRLMAMLRSQQGVASHIPGERIALACDRILAEWDRIPEGRPVDIIRDARRLTLDSLWRSFFCDEAAAAEPNPEVEAVALAIDAHPDAPVPMHIRRLRPLAEFICNRSEDRAPDGSIEAAREIDTVQLFLHAGHDNVAATLSWALWLLARHPEIQDRVRVEWTGVGAAAARGSVDPADYPVTGAVIRETLRLFPPVVQLVRDVTVDLDVEGRRLEGGFTAVLSLYAMHRNRQWWGQPDAFVPDRFLDGVNDLQRRLVWLPFGTGPRGCVGSGFALVELVVIIGRILQRFQMLANPGFGLECGVDFALRPVGREALIIRPVAGSRSAKAHGDQ